MKDSFQISPPIRLSDFDPCFCGGVEKEEAKAQTKQWQQRIGELQAMLYANARHALVMLFQGMDASGKDGAVRHVLEAVNPAGIVTANFKAPSTEERAHDYLWRVHKALPPYGYIGVFNRSHYEEVLIVRVLKMQPESVWRERYEQINAFEKYLTQNRIILLKFFLHISKKEQAERFRSRLEEPEKRWKFAQADLQMRAKWNDFQKAYEDALNRCSTPEVPWHLVPADKKWFRDFVVARTVVEALENLKLTWPKPLEDLSHIKIR